MPRPTPDLIQLLREIADDYDAQGEPAPTDLLREAADRLQLLQEGPNCGCPSCRFPCPNALSRRL